MLQNSITQSILDTKANKKDKIHRIFLAIEWSETKNEIALKFHDFYTYMRYCEHEGFSAVEMILTLNKKAQNIDNQLFKENILALDLDFIYQDFQAKELFICEKLLSFIEKNIIHFP